MLAKRVTLLNYAQNTVKFCLNKLNCSDTVILAFSCSGLCQLISFGLLVAERHSQKLSTCYSSIMD